MTTREIDHLTVSSLLTLNGDRGVGHVNGFDFEATEGADGVNVEISHFVTGFRTRIAMSRALIGQKADADLCVYLYSRIEARGGLEVR